MFLIWAWKATKALFALTCFAVCVGVQGMINFLWVGPKHGRRMECSSALILGTSNSGNSNSPNSSSNRASSRALSLAFAITAFLSAPKIAISISNYRSPVAKLFLLLRCTFCIARSVLKSFLQSLRHVY